MRQIIGIKTTYGVEASEPIPDNAILVDYNGETNIFTVYEVGDELPNAS
jgi:hypothetical protein